MKIMKSRKIRWGGYNGHRESRKVYKIVVGKPEGKKPLGRLKYSRECNIIIDLLEITSEDLD